ncbi:hypothetical protein HZS55_09115 [Halosimplex rubrum]|uniref:Uncharacterized protein n=1 Tax=Halosimplex rubrum TaxID=869889 RepID=A0A7D5P3Q5_9EURY|nr:hypothetical protein [Halosimplex rubrum]QLH77444.1 hypothetical protein HZS55_09115 [Halosimplex rubrum]
MSNNYDATRDFLTSRETIETEFERDGRELPLKFEDISISEMERIEQLDEEMTDAELLGWVFENYLLKPDLGGDDIRDEASIRRGWAIFSVMMSEWQGASEMEAALESVAGNVDLDLE